MATTWGKPSLSMVARAAFLRSRKSAACSSGLSRICCRRLVAIRARLLSRGHQPAPPSILSSNGQISRQEALGLVEALLRRILGIAGVGAHGKAVAGAVVEHEGADLAEGPHPRLHPTHVRHGRPLVLRTVQDQHGDVHAPGEVVRLGAWLSPRRPEGEAVEDHDRADLRVRSGRHERVHPTATEAKDGQPLEISLSDRSQEGHRSLQIGVHGLVRRVGPANLPAVYQGDIAPLGESPGNLRVPVVRPATPRRIKTTGWGPSRSGVARYDGTRVSPSPLVNVTDSSRTVMTDLPPA